MREGQAFTKGVDEDKEHKPKEILDKTAEQSGNENDIQEEILDAPSNNSVIEIDTEVDEAKDNDKLSGNSIDNTISEEDKSSYQAKSLLQNILPSSTVAPKRTLQSTAYSLPTSFYPLPHIIRPYHIHQQSIHNISPPPPNPHTRQLPSTNSSPHWVTFQR